MSSIMRRRRGLIVAIWNSCLERDGCGNHILSDRRPPISSPSIGVVPLIPRSGFVQSIITGQRLWIPGSALTRGPGMTNRPARVNRPFTILAPQRARLRLRCPVSRERASRAKASGTEAVMPRTGLVLVAIAATMSNALTGCSALMFGLSAPEPPSTPSPQTVQFESVPSGAAVSTAAGQTCQTPCSLTLSVESQSVTFAKNGFVPQTIAIFLRQPPPEHSFFSKTPPPTLTPNPIKVALLIAPPPQPV